MTELKKCPHCGGEAKIYIQNKKWTIECKNCFCEISHYTMDSDEMTNAWNRRHEEKKSLTLDEIREVLEGFINYAMERDCMFDDSCEKPDCRDCLMQEFEKKAEEK